MNKDERAREIIGIFKRLSKVLKNRTVAWMELDLKPSPFMVMMQLYRDRKHGAGGRRVSDIASRVGMTVPGTTQILNSLEKEGNVRREADPSDRRVVLVHLTDAGASSMEPAFKKITQSTTRTITRGKLQHGQSKITDANSSGKDVATTGS